MFRVTSKSFFSTLEKVVFVGTIGYSLSFLIGKFWPKTRTIAPAQAQDDDIPIIKTVTRIPNPSYEKESRGRLIFRQEEYKNLEKSGKRTIRLYSSKDGLNFTVIRFKQKEISECVWRNISGTCTSTLSLKQISTHTANEELADHIKVHWERYASSIQAIMFLNKITNLARDEKTAILSVLVRMARPGRRCLINY